MHHAAPAPYGPSQREQQAIVRAALAAHAGKHAEAEAARYAGGYHNLRARADADRYTPAL